MLRGRVVPPPPCLHRSSTSPPLARPPVGLRVSLLLTGKAVRLTSYLQGEAETDIADAVARPRSIGRAVRRAAVPRDVAPVAAAHHAGDALFRPVRIFLCFGAVTAPPIFAPFKDIAAHVVKAECIWKQQAHVVGFAVAVFCVPAYLVEEVGAGICRGCREQRLLPPSGGAGGGAFAAYSHSASVGKR